MPKNRVDFYFDYLSPYAYLAWLRLRELSLLRNIELVPKPVVLGALLRHWGQLGPAEIPPKALFVFKDCARHARRMGAAFRAPALHPFNPLTALRVSLPTVSAPAELPVIDALWRAGWGAGLDLGSRQVIAEVLTETGVDGEALVARTDEPEVKALLKANTEQAIGLGTFGVPTMVIDSELFWGLDQIPTVLECLEGRDPLQGLSLAELAPQGVGAERRR